MRLESLRKNLIKAFGDWALSEKTVNCLLLKHLSVLLDEHRTEPDEGTGWRLLQKSEQSESNTLPYQATDIFADIVSLDTSSDGDQGTVFHLWSG